MVEYVVWLVRFYIYYGGIQGRGSGVGRGFLLEEGGLEVSCLECASGRLSS